MQSEELKTYKDIEDFLFSQARAVYVQTLERIDDLLFLQRDKKFFKNSLRESRPMKTRFGRIVVKKRKYRVEVPFTEPYTVCLLDKYLSIEQISGFTLSVAEEIDKMRNETLLSFKSMAEELEHQFELKITRQAVYNLYQEYQNSRKQTDKQEEFSA